MSTREIDLHGFHPYDDDLHPTIEKALREAYEAEAPTLTIVHGHGHNRTRPIWQRAPFVNSNTGFLGVTVGEGSSDGRLTGAGARGRRSRGRRPFSYASALLRKMPIYVKE
jgi:hypothetical protein